METVKTSFKGFDNPISQHMRWLDPKVWEDDNAYGRDLLEFLANHFAVPLSVTRFNHNNNGKDSKLTWKQILKIS